MTSAPHDSPGPHIAPRRAARGTDTERVKLAGNVLNLPLRPPAVLTRAAASLDRLSGGRFELGLGRSTNDGGIVLDVGALDAIEVLPGNRFRVGSGARWGHVARALEPHGLAMSSGDYGDVGVAGLATAGGIGLLGRRHGLTIDHVTAELVLADGSVVRADAEQHPDLLWAVRGAGGNFGIVTALELDAHPLRDVVYAELVFDGGDLPALLERWGDAVNAAPRELTSFPYAFARREAPAVRILNVYAEDDAGAAIEALTPLLAIAPLLDHQAGRVPYSAVVPAHDAQHLGGMREPPVSNGFATRLTPAIGELLDAGQRARVAPWVAIRSVGGAVGDLDRLATAYAHRHQRFNVSSVGSTQDAFRAHWDELRPHLDGLYISFETDDRVERLHDAFPASADAAAAAQGRVRPRQRVRPQPADRARRARGVSASSRRARAEGAATRSARRRP